jgi:hypothetical protein
MKAPRFLCDTEVPDERREVSASDCENLRYRKDCTRGEIHFRRGVRHLSCLSKGGMAGHESRRASLGLDGQGRPSHTWAQAQKAKAPLESGALAEV